MKIYHFGAEDAPVLLLLPGTCCHWKSNFGAVIPLLADSFRVLCVSYDGFDETEQTEFPTMLEETEKIEAYLKTHCGGHIRAAYGCSLGGSFVGLLAARQNIHMDYGILGSSDLDQASPLAASLQTDFLLPLIYPVVRDGKIKAKFLQKRLDKCAKESGDYVKAFLKMFGDARPYVTIEDHFKYRQAVIEAYPCGNYPVFEGYDHMQYQIRDPKGFAEMLAFIAEQDGMPKLPFIRK